ncbi:hypothetical protein DVH24_004472 [Malus domestica]|uniref:Uncharacterized protein n=1 Tax=Malus domestica TaxID=3750 RepID=A0A498I9Y3_MALDO|nr:hypothetical protein DVH24_004472 [Malus domestica]
MSTQHLKWTSSPKNGRSPWRCSTPTDGISPELHINAHKHLVVVSSPELAMEVLHTHGVGSRRGGAPHQRSSKNGPPPPPHYPAGVSMSQMYRATPQSILDWATDQLALGASQLGRVEGFHRVLGSFFSWVLGKMPSAGTALMVIYMYRISYFHLCKG